MISLVTQAERRPVQNLPFCYLCGKNFQASDTKNRDHVPPDSIFQVDHKDPLILPTHQACNSAHTLTDEKIAQLIALRYGKKPTDPNHRRLIINAHIGAITNLDVDEAVWRWISGFHAALYKEPAIDIRENCALVTPFPRGRMVDGKPVIDPILPQHGAFVQAIKDNRARNNLDKIQCNKGNLTYECVWNQADNNGPWMCFFALDVYDWKDLGRVRDQDPRGCAGFYVLPSGLAPSSATLGISERNVSPNLDTLDPFAL
jgi:hypothetical protein